MNRRLSKIRSVHTYVIPRTFSFGWICNLDGSIWRVYSWNWFHIVLYFVYLPLTCFVFSEQFWLNFVILINNLTFRGKSMSLIDLTFFLHSFDISLVLKITWKSLENHLKILKHKHILDNCWFSSENFWLHIKTFFLWDIFLFKKPIFLKMQSSTLEALIFLSKGMADESLQATLCM